MKLPMIVINRSGYSRDTQRLNNFHNEVKYEITSKNRVYDYLTPVPVNLQYEVSVMARNPSDIDQIASNFIVFFNSSLYVSCIHPKYEGIKMNNQVVMDDSVSEEHADELDGSTDDFVTSTFNFTFKTFLFAGTMQSKRKHAQIVSSYTSSFVSSEIVVIAPDEISAFHSQYPNVEVSAALTSNVTSTVTCQVDDPDSTDDVYDFVPTINNIEIGFYPTPQPSGHVEYMNVVDTQYKDVTYNRLGYISSESYISSYDYYIDEDGNEQSALTAVTPVDMKYDFVDTTETIAPYKDRLYWKIDGASAKEFPDNVGIYRKHQLR